MSKLEPVPSFVAGATPSADTLYDFMYSPLTPSLELLNGQLDGENFTDIDSRFIEYPLIQTGALASAQGVAGTANLDYFSGGSTVPDGSGFFRNANLANTKRYLAIPGASVQFYLPYPAWVLFTWSLSLTNDNEIPTTVKAAKDISSTSDLTDTSWSQVSFFIDGDPAGPSLQDSASATRINYGSMGDETNATIGRAFNADPRLQDRYKGRFWAGHYFAQELPAGYHSASLRVCASSRVKQTRFRARSMKYIYFKHGAT